MGFGSVKDVAVGYEERPLGAEDDDVVRCRGQREEEHFELKADSQENSAGHEGQDAAVHRVLQGATRAQLRQLRKKKLKSDPAGLKSRRRDATRTNRKHSVNLILAGKNDFI